MFDTEGMTSTTTKEQALKVLQILTAEHGNAPYFKGAEVTYADGFHGVDLKVDGEGWRGRDPKSLVPPAIERVPICVMVYG